MTKRQKLELDRKAMDFVMPYGKHRGRRLGDINQDDRPYLEWIDREWNHQDSIWYWASWVVGMAQRIHDREMQNAITRDVERKAVESVDSELTGAERWKAMIDAKAVAHAGRYPTFLIGWFRDRVAEQPDSWLMWAAGQSTAVVNRALKNKWDHNYLPMADEPPVQSLKFRIVG